MFRDQLREKIGRRTSSTCVSQIWRSTDHQFDETRCKQFSYIHHHFHNLPFVMVFSILFRQEPWWAWGTLHVLIFSWATKSPKLNIMLIVAFFWTTICGFQSPMSGELEIARKTLIGTLYFPCHRLPRVFLLAPLVKQAASCDWLENLHMYALVALF